MAKTPSQMELIDDASLSLCKAIGIVRLLELQFESTTKEPTATNETIYAAISIVDDLIEKAKSSIDSMTTENRSNLSKAA